MFMQQMIVEKIEIRNDLAQESLISYNGMINNSEEKIKSRSYLLHIFFSISLILFP